MAPRNLGLCPRSSAMFSIDLMHSGIGRDSRASAILTQLTPCSADRLHYSQGLPGGGLDIDEA